MERWFFYITYQQIFLNGSLDNVRSVFRLFLIVYDVHDNGNGLFTIGYGSFNKTYALNIAAARRVLRMISDRYCNGEDSADYYSWIIVVEKD